MPKFFIMSDIHGFYDEMKSALDKSGFDENNPEHWVVTCGDHFDRGPKPLEVLRYLRRLPRKILVKGNHEELLVKCCESGYPGMHDYSNGTYGTICEIGDAGEGYSFDECCNRALTKVHLFLDSMVDYFETKNYIFVHSWVPLASKDGLPAYYTRNRKFEFNPNWRDASSREWEDSRWGNPFELAEQGLLPDKTIIFGHWHCSTGWAKAEGRSEFGEDAKFEPYYGEGFIAIDGCTAHTGKCNVVVIDDEFLEG
jgi:hypothetical protein